jgi:predicted Zn-dependent protease with MMP-like domain
MPPRSDRPERRDALDAALESVDIALDDGDLDRAHAELARATELSDEDHPDVLFARASIAWQEHGSERAEPHLTRLLERDPQHADAHHALACAAQERGDERRAIEHFLRVYKLDARNDREARIGTRAELDHIEAVARKVIDALPSPFAERLAHVPVVLERRPSRALVETGFDPRALGLFEGEAFALGNVPAPTRIVLFVNNLLAEFPEDPELSEEIEITLLHEIGHFFGLDEDDMERLGLD